MERIDPPAPIAAVLRAALDAVAKDPRFYGVPNGRIEVAWRQPTKGRNGEGDRPARYAISFECLFVQPKPRDEATIAADRDGAA